MIVTENQLDEWVRGNAKDAQGVIVELVWRLVAASSPSPRERRFPLGDSIGQHGPDGLLEVDLAFDPFVPEGRSYWEIGTGLKAGKKATSDYKDLTAETPESVRLASTFIFVTPLSGRRDWEHTWKGDAQCTWIQKRVTRGQWQDVRVIDGTKLIDWIKQFPPVELWLAQRMSGGHGHMRHLETPEQHWSVIRTIGEPPPLTPGLFLVGRDEACARLKQVVAGTAGQLKLETHFPDHVVNFVAACLADLETETRADAAGRWLIVSGVDAWDEMTSRRDGLVLVADSTLDLSGELGTKLIQKARRSGHAVVFGGPAGGIPDPASVPLRVPGTHQVRGALEEAGYSEERARTLAQKSSGNIGSLLRCLQNLSLMPEWAEGTVAAELAIAAVLGSWTDTSSADRAIAEGLSGKPYGEWIGTMRDVALRPGTPLIQREGNWKFTARYEGWFSLGPRLFDDHLDRLRLAAISVLTERDPQFDLPGKERYASTIHGKVLSHSTLVRNGLAESLALLGSHPRALSSCTPGMAEVTARLAVRTILDEADWERWASLNRLLPLLAEAAPGEFLHAVEKALASDPCPFDQVFAEESDGFTGRTYMSGLLWALETLAWDPDHLIRVVICLGELAARDPGGRWSNRPENSLTNIFLPWLPQTCAPVAQRRAAMSALLAEFPDVAWELLVSLLPQSHSTSSGTRRPAWRDTIPDDWSKGVTNREYREQIELYSRMAISAAKSDREKLAELINHIENLLPSAREQVLAYLGSAAVIGMPEADRLDLWMKLVDLITKHTRFSDAPWALRPEDVDSIASVADRIAPAAPALRYQRLFSERDFALYEQKGNYEQQRGNLEVRRQEAVLEVAAAGGTQAVVSFADAVESPWRVGVAFGAVAGLDVDDAVLPDLLDSEQKRHAEFSGGFVLSRYRLHGWQWVDGIDVGHWTSDQIGQFLAFLPFEPGTWERVKRLLGEGEVNYWSKTNASPYETDVGLDLAIDRLVHHGRPIAALRCVEKMLRDKQPFDHQRAVQALLAALESTEGSPIDAYQTTEIIKALQEDPATSRDDLLRVEWAYLPLLDRHSGAFPKLLGRRLAAEPGFYCEVIRLVFRSEKEDRPTEEPGADEQRIATNAYRLLREWRIPPGLQADGSYDGTALKRWLKAVKRECSKTGHLEIAMTMVGHSLIHVPSDPDGLWIHRSAAAALNAKDAGDMRDGFQAELYNSRGAHWVDPTGTPERELAAKYRAEAEAVEQAGFHRLATTLRELATSYDREAESVVSLEHFRE